MAQGHKTGGRQRGTPNKITTAFKEAVRIVYDDIGGHAAFAAWARENPTEFYKIAARLIPAEVNVSNERAITVIVDRGAALDDGNSVIEGERAREVSPTVIGIAH